MMPHKDLFTPLLRAPLIECLEDLAREPSRERVFNIWPDSSHEFWDSIQTTIDVLDDTDMYDSSPENHIGYIFYNHAEAQAISAVIEAMNQVRDLQDSSATVNHWSCWGVIRAARHAYNVMLGNEPYDSPALEAGAS